jgi:predicted Zn-dependent peptidase
MEGSVQRMLRFAIVLIAVLAGGNAGAALDLRSASVERLDNGLTVILLEDRNLPVVSVQMLYRVGARDESYGRTGIAHFLEHMAFRSSANFPDTGLVSSIYAVGGEWHGYTWTDQTTYFATVPKEYADLLLSIEADRMHRLTIAKDDMEAERGAVLAEMHMYENYPSSMLLDALMFTSFLAHPYRNNTIGFQSDIEALEHADVVAFYERHYRPANGVLAVVGDFDREEIRARIEELFGEFTSREPTPLPHTLEPVQQGERRIRLEARTEAKRFMIGYRAPSANHPDFAAFLVLQEVLGKGSGVNFRQNDWGTAVDEGSLLDGAAADLTTWYPPSAQDYIFVIGGSAAPDAIDAAVEAKIEERVTSARQGVDDDTVRRAVADVLDELVFDVVTTEDAAHQLAFFDGLHALDTLLELPERVAAVTREDLRRVARHWLLPERRTIAWHVPGVPAPATTRAPEPAGKDSIQAKPAGQVDRTPMPEPVTRELAGGIPVIVQPSDLSPSAYLQVLLPAASIAGVAATPNDPVPGHSSLSWRFRPHALGETLRKARTAVDEAQSAADSGGDEPSQDPETRLEQTFTSIMEEGAERRSPSLAPALIVVSGDIDADEAFTLVEDAFGDLRAPGYRIAPGRAFEREDVEISLGVPVPQAQLGYIVPAPGARDERSWAWRMLLYVLSHDYEGRLGKEAISRRGLAYYIDSRYRSDGVNGWITLAVGVDPEKLADLKALMLEELQRLEHEPPSESEIAEAKAHLVGRARSAAQSNAELADALARSWVLHGEVVTAQELRTALARISRTDVLRAVEAFAGGNAVTVAE